MATVNEIYNFIGNEIVNNIGEDWSSAELAIEAYFNQYAEFTGRYFTKMVRKKELKPEKCR